MATLADVQFSINGERQITDSNAPVNKLSGIVYYENSKEYPGAKEWHIFKLVNNTKKGGVTIPTVDDVINPATGQMERIRLLSGVPSIWMKDQKDLTLEFIKQNIVHLRFERGMKMLRIAGHNTTTLEYLRVCNSNAGNKKRVRGTRFEFFEFDAAAAEKEAIQLEMFEFEQGLIAMQTPVDEMEKHAAFLGIKLLNDYGLKKTPDGIRKEYMLHAKRNPKYFKETYRSTEVEINWLILKAITDSKIEIGREPGKIHWAKDGGYIGSYPSTMSPHKYLTELATLPTEEGRRFKEHLQRIST